ncbi:MAG: beta-lactamase, partial [Dehalococcoidia bacterium DG_18]
MAKKKITLRDICYYRSGDKGDISNIGLMAKDEKAYKIIKKEVTPERIKAHFKDWVKGDVIIYPMDNLQSLEIMLYQALGGGATKTLRIDQTGKAMGNALSRMEIEVDES